MSMQDPIADLLTQIRNGQSARKKEITLPSSKQKVAIVNVLKKEGYISDYSVVKSNKPVLNINLKYFKDKPVITKIGRVSRSSLRVYECAKKLPKVLGGLGILIVSTPKGVMSDSQAKKLWQGGEVLCFVE